MKDPYRLVPLIATIILVIIVAFLSGYFSGFLTRPNPMVTGKGLPSMEDMLAYCKTDDYYHTEVECIQDYLRANQDLKCTGSPPICCGGKIIGLERCY